LSGEKDTQYSSVGSPYFAVLRPRLRR
jgi:hypothetical protein